MRVLVVFGIVFSSLFSFRALFTFVIGNRNCFCFRFQSDWCVFCKFVCIECLSLFLSIWFLSWLLSSSISFIDQGHRHFVNDLPTLILMTLFVDDGDGVVSLLLSHTHWYAVGCHFFHVKYGPLKATA